MENNEKLKRVTSKYILQNIISYIYDINLPFKLFIHSKFFQQALELNYFDYQVRYFDKLGINFLDYIYLDYSQFSDSFDKDILKKNLDKKLSELKIKIDAINKYAFDYLKNYYLKNKEKQEEFIIDIFSPFFDLISKSEFFEHIFTIPISIKEIEEYDLKNDFILFFSKINKSNQKYSSLYFKFKDSADFDYFEKFKINFKQIKRLTINEKKDVEINYYNNKFTYSGLISLSHFRTNTNTFYKKLFLLEDLQNNLIYLNIDISGRRFIEKEYFMDLNNCKSLKELNLNHIYISTNFVLNLKNLEKINFKNCRNLSFAEDSCLKVKIFKIFSCKIIKPNKRLKMPELEECILQDEFHLSEQLYNEIIDFSSLKKLKILEAEKYDFIYLNDSLLKKVKLFSKNSFYSKNEKEIELKVIEKLINIGTLKEIYIILRQINNNDISNIKGVNHSVKDICVNWKNENDCLLYSLQDKFSKLNNLIVKISNMKREKEIYVKIKGNSNCNTHEININCNGEGNIELYVESFENLFRVNFSFDNKINDIENLFPIFNDKCSINFKFLTHFSFTYYLKIFPNILNNIINNIDKVPNLREFYFYCFYLGDEESIQKLFKKIISLNLDIVNIEIKIKEKEKEKYYESKRLYINKFNKLYLSE